MHEIRSCDFCGQDATGTYEIVPPELDPTEAEQRRVALCSGCKVQLEELIEPLLARALGSETGTSGSETGASGSETARATPSDGQSGVRSPIGSDVAGEGSSRRLPSVMETADDRAEADQRTAGEASPSEPDGSEASGGLSGDDRSNAGEADASEERGGVTSDGETSASQRGASQTSANGGATGEQHGGSGDAATTATRPIPEKYGAVMRLLSNREFPVKRPAVEDLAASAYDLENDEVQEILEYAIEVGDFVAEGDQLDKP